MSAAILGGIALAIGAAALAMGKGPAASPSSPTDPNLPPSTNGSQSDGRRQSSGNGGELVIDAVSGADPNTPPSDNPASVVGSADQLAPGGNAGGDCPTCGTGWKSTHTAQSAGAANVAPAAKESQRHGDVAPLAKLSPIDQNRALRADGPRYGVVF